MYTTSFRKVGGSVMLAIPPAFLDQLHVEAGAVVGLMVEGERLVVVPKPGPRYTMARLLAQSDYAHPMTDDEKAEERQWLDAPRAGGELV